MKQLTRIALNAGCSATLAWLALAGAPAVAQDAAANPFIGKWTVNWDGKSKVMEANLEIKSDGGTWKAYSAGRYDTCGGHDIPVEIKSADAESMALKVRYDDTIAGCKDWNIRLQREADGKITGKRGETVLTLTRK